MLAGITAASRADVEGEISEKHEKVDLLGGLFTDGLGSGERLRRIGC